MFVPSLSWQIIAYIEEILLTQQTRCVLACLRACVVSQGNSIDVCTQQAGDLVFVPGLWHHATLNLAETVAVAWRTS